MKYTALIAALLLSACGQNIPATAWPRAEAMCAPFEGLHSLDYKYNQWTNADLVKLEATCQDGTVVHKKFNIKWVQRK